MHYLGFIVEKHAVKFNTIFTFSTSVALVRIKTVKSYILPFPNTISFFM